ncbi:MAG: transcriptional regulator, partial [Methanomethylophilus sp.]
AISQYLKKKRGGSVFIEQSRYYDNFIKEIKVSAKRVVEGTSDMASEMCRICKAIKNMGLLAEIYTENTGAPAPRCAWGDGDETYCAPIEPE